MTTAYDIASTFLRALGAPDTAGMRRAVAIWLKFESGGTVTGNNPWNLHSGAPCTQAKGFCAGQGSLPGQIGNRYAGPGDRNVAVFSTMDAGVKASANNLLRLAPSYGYGRVISQARAGNPIGFLSALQASSWSAGHYSYSKLVNAFKGGLSYNYTINVRPVGGGSVGPPNPDAVPSPAPTPGTGGTYADKFYQLLRNLGISTDPTHVITMAEANKIVAAFGSVFGGGAHPQPGSFAGKTVGQIAGNLQSSGDAIAGAPAAIANAVLGPITSLVAYVLGVILILAGLWLYSKSNSSAGVPVAA